MEFYARPPDIVAEALLGKLLVREVEGELISGVIVETEAYLATDDPASHSFRGKKNKNRSMFAAPGTLYVYPIHAKYCMNAVTEAQGRGSAVLIRAIEPWFGLDRMAENRSTSELLKLCRGPGMLCQALGVDRRHDGLDLTLGNSVWIEELSASPREVFPCKGAPRIGIRVGTEFLLRFFLDGNVFVSGRKGEHSIRPTRGSFLDPDG